MPLLKGMCHLFPAGILTADRVSDVLKEYIKCWVTANDAEGISALCPCGQQPCLLIACLSIGIKDLAWAGARPLGHTYLYTFTHLTCFAPR